MKTALRQRLKFGDLRVSDDMERLEEAYNKRYHAEIEALQSRASKRDPYHQCSLKEIQLYTYEPYRLF